jgi:hypothetical protein
MNSQIPVFSELSRACGIPVTRVENAYAVMFNILQIPDNIPPIVEYVEEVPFVGYESNKKRVKNFLLLLDKYIKEQDDQKKIKHFEIFLTGRNAHHDLMTLMCVMKYNDLLQRLMEVLETSLADGNITEGDYLDTCNALRDMYSVSEMVMIVEPSGVVH